MSARALEIPRPARRVPGEPGIWVLLGGEFLVFTALFVALLGTRAADPSLARAAQPMLHRDVGAINTLLLLTSSLLVALAVSARRAGRTVAVPRMLAGALLCGTAFAVLKVSEYHSLYSAGITPATNSFLMYYFVLTGLHLMHVAVGLCVLAALGRAGRSTPAPGRADARLFENGGIYWHMVDGLWLIIYPLVYLVH